MVAKVTIFVTITLTMTIKIQFPLVILPFYCNFAIYIVSKEDDFRRKPESGIQR